MATLVIKSLPWKEALQRVLEIVRTWGPSALPMGLQLLDHQKAGNARKEPQETLAEIRDVLEKALRDVQPREIRVVPEAFNSTPTFLDYYQMAAVGAIPLAILQAANAIDRVGKSLDGIKSELASGNTLKIIGCGGGFGFGSYVHRFVKEEMAVDRRTSKDADDQHHYFYVWNPDTIWYDEFAERQRQEPLGPAFGGYHHDLVTISLRMRSDRRALIETTDHGKTAVFHLIIPAYHPIVVEDPIVFAEELLPLVITGRHQGVDFVWLNLGTFPSRLHLDSVSLLSDGDMALLQKTGDLGLGSSCGFVACIAAAIIFPPCAPLAEQVALPFAATFLSAVTVGTIVQERPRKSPQILGCPVFLSPSHD